MAPNVGPSPLHWTTSKFSPISLCTQLLKCSPFTKEPFNIEALYTYPKNIPYSIPHIGNFTVHDVNSAPDGGPSKIKVKLHLNKHGIFKASEAVFVEKLGEQSESADASSPEKVGEEQNCESGATKDDIVQNGDAKDDQPMEVKGDPTADPEQPKGPSTYYFSRTQGDLSQQTVRQNL